MRYQRHGLCGKCGVYLITCLPTGKRYRGSSVNLCSRINQHFEKTCVNKYKNVNPFYADIAKYGRDAFDVEVLEYCTKDQKIRQERSWYLILQPEYNQVEPNDCPFKTDAVQNKARIGAMTQSAKLNRSEAHRTPEYLRKAKAIQRHRMIPCKAISQEGIAYQFESLCEAARWLNRSAAIPSVVNNIRRSICRNGTAFGYRWEVMTRCES